MEVNGLEGLIYIITIFFIPVQSATYFELIKDSEIPSNANTDNPLVNKRFFQCDRDIECKYVVKSHGSNELKIVSEENVLLSPGNFAKIWKKFQIDHIHNLALEKAVSMTAIFRNATVASNAVDGNRGTEFNSCAQSVMGNPSWLQVDMGKNAVVKSVHVISLEALGRTMKQFNIKVGQSTENGGQGNSACGTGITIPNSDNNITVQCPESTVGRYVSITVNGYIEVCEIEVLGYFIS
ncbi:fucolectin-4-like [Rhopilema esculentum]|uniref:fucolectin-4-like n=1 Tax=Rhopilema esculentum TaxID=499914 RepID=UPI0031DB771E